MQWSHEFSWTGFIFVCLCTCDYGTVLQQWKPDLLHKLTVPPSIYCAVVDEITSHTQNDHQSSFQYVFKMLARKGVFLDECDDTIITEAMLASSCPLSIVSYVVSSICIVYQSVLTYKQFKYSRSSLCKILWYE